MSELFTVTNGVRQGGIISPKLFNTYIDKLSVKLNESNVGCCFNNSVVNHLYYVDDLCLPSPSVHGLRELLSVTERFAAANEITFNEAKRVCLYA